MKKLFHLFLSFLSLASFTFLEASNLSFFDKLEERSEKAKTLLCVGINPHRRLLRENSSKGVLNFCEKIIRQTSPHALCFKINSAFFEAYGPEGLYVLKKAIKSIPADIPVILDIKRGEVLASAVAHKEAFFDHYGVDAVTINPFLGSDSIEPFLSNPFKGVFLITKTSNPSSGEIQDLLIEGEEGGEKIPLYQFLARRFNEHPLNSQIGLVAGSKEEAVLKKIRDEAPLMWILTPGFIREDGKLEQVLKGALRKDGKGVLVSISQAITADKEPGKKAEYYKQLVNASIEEVAHGKSIWPKDPLFEKVARGLIESSCVEFGSFSMRSGANSPIYVDLRKLISYPQLMDQVANLFLKMMKEIKFDRMAGLPYSGLPIGTAISVKGKIPMIFARKELNTLESKQLVEGVYKKGEQVVVIDDMIISGKTKLEHVALFRPRELNVKDVVVLIDKEKGGKERLKSEGITLHAAFTLADLLNFWRDEELISQEEYDNTNSFLKAEV